MSTRVKLLSGGAGTVALALLILGLLMTMHQREVYEEEVRSKAQLLLAAIAVPCVPALAQGHFEELDRTIEEFKLRMGESAEVERVAVYDRGGRVVGHTDKGLYGTLAQDDFATRAVNAPDMLFERRGRGEELSLDVAMPISTSIGGHPGLRWGTITARFGLAHLERQIEAARWRILGFAVLAALVTALFLFFLAERLFLRPVGLLTNAAEEMRQGNLAARAGLDGKGEVSMLGRTLDSMAEELEKHTTSLQGMVEERTQELFNSNEELRSTMGLLQEANDQLEQQVRTDALTELYNRRQLQESLSFQFALSRRGRHPLSFAMLDVDQFKHYNDTNGHPAGDEVLKAVAAIIRERVRQTDLPCRYGGEEFAVMFPDTDLDHAGAVAEELRRKIEEADFPNQQAQPTGNLTISIGVAALSPGMSSPEELIAMADKALYDAKSSGRNRVSRREPTPPPPGQQQ